MTRAELERLLRAAGKTHQEIAELFAEHDHVTGCLDRKCCPQCGAPLTRTLDTRQDGDTFGYGLWFNYRCTGCGYMVDRAEEAN